MKDITMKKILSLILVFSFFASEANFMEKVKELPGAAKKFGIKTIDTAKANKPKAIFTTLQIALTAHRLYALGKPEFKKTLLVEDKSNLFSLGENSLLGNCILELCNKNGYNVNQIKNKNLKPIKYVQDFFHDGIGGTLFILEILKRLTTKAK